jgi:hypothetical protein
MHDFYSDHVCVPQFTLSTVHCSAPSPKESCRAVRGVHQLAHGMCWALAKAWGLQKVLSLTLSVIMVTAPHPVPSICRGPHSLCGHPRLCAHAWAQDGSGWLSTRGVTPCAGSNLLHSWGPEVGVTLCQPAWASSSSSVLCSPHHTAIRPLGPHYRAGFFTPHDL